MLGHALVQREGENQRIRKRAGDMVGLKQCRHHGLTAESSQAFGNIKYQIPSVAAGQALYQAPDIADARGLISQRLQRLLKGSYGFRLIKFCRLFFAVP